MRSVVAKNHAETEGEEGDNQNSLIFKWDCELTYSAGVPFCCCLYQLLSFPHLLQTPK